MNRICKEYMIEVKALFPIKRKPEREYIRKIASDIEGFCEDAKVTNKEELYEKYGNPSDVVNSYLRCVDIEYISKQIRTTRIVKTVLSVLLVLATIATSAFCVYLYSEYYSRKKQEVVVSNDIVGEYN
ncbi:MAG: hypothetical protein IKK10_04345 [Clostridia bacterium]|nr:hypothetical protein [Clostridia bacterium]